MNLRYHYSLFIKFSLSIFENYISDLFNTYECIYRSRIEKKKSKYFSKFYLFNFRKFKYIHNHHLHKYLCKYSIIQKLKKKFFSLNFRFYFRFSKDTNNHHVQLQICTNISFKRIKKKKNFSSLNFPIPVDSQIVRSKNVEANNRSAFSAEGTRKMSKRGRHTLVPRRNRLMGTDGFRDHEGAGTQNRFLHDRSISHPLLRNANAKYIRVGIAQYAQPGHTCARASLRERVWDARRRDASLL